MNFFALIITLAITTAAALTFARIIERRRRPTLPGESVQVDTEELHRIAETITDLSGRMERLEE